MLAKARFVDAKMHGWTGYRTSSFTQGALITAEKKDTAKAAFVIAKAIV